MKRLYWLLLAIPFFLLPHSAAAQTTQEKCQQGACYGYGAPTGSCVGAFIYSDISQTPVQAYSCKGFAWAANGGGSSSVITSYLYISQLGCAAQNVNLNTGLTFPGGNATDDAPCINAALANATAQKQIILIQDGASLVSGIFGPAAGNWGIIGLGGGLTSTDTLYGTGFYMKEGSNNDVIHNGSSTSNCVNSGGHSWSDPGWGTPGAAPARGSNLYFANFIINGNRGNGTTGNSNSGTPQGIGTFSGLYTPAYCWYFGINAMNINNVTVDGVVFYNTSSYNLRVMNAGNVHVRNSTFANVGFTGSVTPQNGDGIHVSGPANDLYFDSNYFRTTDDAIALNSPEGWVGPITNVQITNSSCVQCQNMFRAYTGSIAPPSGDAAPTVSNVGISNYNGNPGPTAILLGLEVSRTLTVLNTITGFKWSNSTISGPIFAIIDDNLGDITFDNVTWNSGTTGTGMFMSAVVASQVNSLDLHNLTIGVTSTNHAVTSFVDTTQSFFDGGGSTTYQQVFVNGAKVLPAPGYAYGGLPQVVNIASPSNIEDLGLNAVDFTNILQGFNSTSATRIPSSPAFGTQNGVVRSYVSLTTATSDAVAMQGTTVNSYCTIAAANAAGATALSNIYYDASTAPSITLHHTATVDSGAFVVLECTIN